MARVAKGRKGEYLYLELYVTVILLLVDLRHKNTPSSNAHRMCAGMTTCGEQRNCCILFCIGDIWDDEPIVVRCWPSKCYIIY